MAMDTATKDALIKSATPTENQKTLMLMAASIASVNYDLSALDAVAKAKDIFVIVCNPELSGSIVPAPTPFNPNPA